MISSNNSCSIPYLDCRGYFDLATDIVTAVAAFLILIRSLHNLRELKSERNNQNQTQYTHAINRKIFVNIINIIYISTFQVHLAFSMILFQVINEIGTQEIVSHKLHLWYKFSEVLFVQFLNSLLITVGWLYWKGLQSFYKVKDIPAPLVYKAKFQYCFFYIIAYMIGVILIGLINPFVQNENFQIVLSWLLVMGSILSVSIFLTFRLLYYRNILCSVKLSKNSILKQKIHNFIILLTSFGRVALCIIQLINLDFQSLREYDPTNCHDMKPYTAILLLFVGVVINLIPSFIFTSIFVTLQRQTNSNVDQTLFSALQSEYTIYTR